MEGGTCILFYAEGSDELEKWIEEKRSLLYEGRTEELISQLEDMEKNLSKRAKRDKGKREVLPDILRYERLYGHDGLSETD